MSPMRVVVADDSNLFRSALCDILRQVPDVEVTAVAQDGVEALDLVQTVKPDTLLLDIEMPRMDGWEVLQQLQTTTSPPRVLMISSHSASSVRHLALQRGAYAYINKGNAQQILDTLYGLAVDSEHGSSEVRSPMLQKM